MTVSWNMMLKGSSRDTNTSFLTTSSVRGEIPSPVWLLMAKASAFHVVMVSGTSLLCTAIPDALMVHRGVNREGIAVSHCITPNYLHFFPSFVIILFTLLYSHMNIAINAFEGYHKSLISLITLYDMTIRPRNSQTQKGQHWSCLYLRLAISFIHTSLSLAIDLYFSLGSEDLPNPGLGEEVSQLRFFLWFWSSIRL